MYDVNYFIDKFEKIPEELWCVNAFGMYKRGGIRERTICSEVSKDGIRELSEEEFAKLKSEAASNGVHIEMPKV